METSYKKHLKDRIQNAIKNGAEDFTSDSIGQIAVIKNGKPSELIYAGAKYYCTFESMIFKLKSYDTDRTILTVTI